MRRREVDVEGLMLTKRYCFRRGELFSDTNDAQSVYDSCDNLWRASAQHPRSSETDEPGLISIGEGRQRERLQERAGKAAAKRRLSGHRREG